MTEAQDPKRWADGGADVPDELARLLRDAQGELGSRAEIADLAGRLASVLGPVSGLSEQTTSELDAPERFDLPAPHDPSTGGGSHLLRLGKWLLGGASVVGSIWWVASGASSLPGEMPGGAPPPASVQSVNRGPSPSSAASSAREAPDASTEPGGAAPMVVEGEAPDTAGSTATPRRHALSRRSARRTSGSRSTASASGEAALLERAQAALATHPERALELTRQHQHQFSNGALVEEREVIAIEALKRLGRSDAARARSAAFERQYQGSVHRPRIERALDSAPRSRGGPNTRR